MRALVGDWLAGRLSMLLLAARAHAFPWPFSVVCMARSTVRHTRPIPAQAPGAPGPRPCYMSHRPLVLIPRSRTSGSKPPSLPKWSTFVYRALC